MALGALLAKMSPAKLQESLANAEIMVQAMAQSLANVDANTAAIGARLAALDMGQAEVIARLDQQSASIAQLAGILRDLGDSVRSLSLNFKASKES